MNSRFNLSDWALEHRSLVWYFMIVFGIAGIFAYINLGREEDPSFTIKTMVIAAQWPGATVEETSLQVTDRIEKKLEELDSLDYTRSQTTPGQTVIYVNLKDTTKARDVPGVWVKVRNMVNDVKRELPQGVVGPVLQRRLRRRVWQRLRVHRGWADAAAVARLCRGRAGQGSHGAECRQGQPDRRPGRGDLPGILDARDGGPRHQPAGRHPDAPGPECDHPLRRHPGRS